MIADRDMMGSLKLMEALKRKRNVTKTSNLTLIPCKLHLQLYRMVTATLPLPGESNPLEKNLKRNDT
jgi:hypothetical protein